MEIVCDKDEVNNAKDKGSSLREFPVYKSNPFLEGLKIPLAPKPNMFIERGERAVKLFRRNFKEDVIVIGKKEYVDEENFIKIFVEEIESMFDLTSPAKKLFTYMLSKVGYDDKLHFDTQDYKASLKYKSTPQIFVGKKELLINKFIAKTIWRSVYWINPKLFYPGDSLSIITDYRAN